MRLDDVCLAGLPKAFQDRALYLAQFRRGLVLFTRHIEIIVQKDSDSQSEFYLEHVWKIRQDQSRLGFMNRKHIQPFSPTISGNSVMVMRLAVIQRGRATDQRRMPCAPTRIRRETGDRQRS